MVLADVGAARVSVIFRFIASERGFDYNRAMILTGERMSRVPLISRFIFSIGDIGAAAWGNFSQN